MLVTESGITIDTKLMQPKKAPSAMLLIESGITIDERFTHGTHWTTPRGLLLLA